MCRLCLLFEFYYKELKIWFYLLFLGRQPALILSPDLCAIRKLPPLNHL